MKRFATLAVFVAFATLAAAPNASARTELVSSNPAEGAQVATAPSQLTLTFDEPVDPGATTVTIRGADDTTWAVGSITADGTTLTVPVLPAGPAGPYTIEYRINMADGDPVTGAIRFTLATAVPPLTTKLFMTSPPATPSSPAAQPAGAGGGALPVWVWILLGSAVVAMVAVGVIVHRSGTRRAGRS